VAGLLVLEDSTSGNLATLALMAPAVVFQMTQPLV